jgi:large subunit ribosomal protein L21
MYAIVEIAGQQFKVEKDRYIYTHKLAHEAGSDVTFDKVLLVDNDGSIQVGVPTVNGASVSAKVLEHLKGEKVVVFRKRRRKGYRKRNGHRQEFSKVLINNIVF